MGGWVVKTAHPAWGSEAGAAEAIWILAGETTLGRTLLETGAGFLPWPL